MKPYLFLLPLALMPWISCAQEATSVISIPLLNPGFEDDSLTCGSQCSHPGITAWLCGPVTEVFAPSTVQFPNGIPGGVNVAALGFAIGTGSILQVTPAVVRANKTYTLRLSVGARADYAFTGYIAALMAGNVILAYDRSLSPVAGTFLKDVIVYKSGPTPAQLGQPLTIFIKSLGTGQVDIDNVSLTVTAQ
jgi:hypothetical protein